MVQWYRLRECSTPSLTAFRCDEVTDYITVKGIQFQDQQVHSGRMTCMRLLYSENKLRQEHRSRG